MDKVIDLPAYVAEINTQIFRDKTEAGARFKNKNSLVS